MKKLLVGWDLKSRGHDMGQKKEFSRRAGGPSRALCKGDWKRALGPCLALPPTCWVTLDRSRSFSKPPFPALGGVCPCLIVHLRCGWANPRKSSEAAVAQAGVKQQPKL